MESIINNNSLKWIFVSGKGGVGKTTCSSSIAVELSKTRESVLLVSTDPAHNLSDIFCQQFNNSAGLVNGFTNLYCMEYSTIEDLNIEKNIKLGNIFSKLITNIPGIEEALGYIKLLKKIKNEKYSTIVFDTAPTGHTLKILNYPELLREAYELLTGSVLGTIFKELMKNMFIGDGTVDNNLNMIDNNINSINNLLTDVNHTTFISVCIPEFLSVFETERFIQQLYKKNIDSHIIIINQVIEVDDESPFLKARQKMQDKYLDMIDELYSDFDLIMVPLWEVEVRGIKNIKEFSVYLYNNFVNDEDEMNRLDSILDEALAEL